MGLLSAQGARAYVELIMSGRTSVVRIMVFVAMLAVTGLPRTAITQTKAAAPKPQDKPAIGEEEVKQLPLLIDTEKRGKITKQEWMKFMEAEFERLDKGKNGELDVKELTQSRLPVSHFLSVGK
jgi:hypothetical protein